MNAAERGEPKTIRLPASLWAQVQALADREDRSLSEQVRNLLKRALADPHPPA